jgi:hypothetical protein
MDSTSALRHRDPFLVITGFVNRVKHPERPDYAVNR